MPVLFFAEHENGVLKKAAFQAATFARMLANAMNDQAEAIAINGNDSDFRILGEYGTGRIHHARMESFIFSDSGFSDLISAIAKSVSAKVVVFGQSYDGRSFAPRVAVALDAAFLSGITSLPDHNNGFQSRRPANSGKGIEYIRTDRDRVVITIKVNSFRAERSPGTTGVIPFQSNVSGNQGAIGIENVRMSNKISITEADTVVSGGRGMKGPENWKILEDLAEILGAGTSCSKPVADMEWRPHHEHVGQTGIQIAPNLYIAIGISGAIQHLAGVNSSKNIVVINKDPEAPFFKIADYGIVGDLFEVLPKITEAAKKIKAGG